MEKYAVEIDPKKVEQEKTAGKGSPSENPNTNIPLDPEKGSLPYEKRPDDPNVHDVQKPKPEGDTNAKA